ncbi:MAG: hypothetical protein KDB80_07915 [Planctomycetes bacterium]|nr:hypothetical protein [Planctomycetota bacterium]
MNIRITCITLLCLASAGPAQMRKRWIDQYDGTVFAQAEPAVGTAAPDLCLWDLDGRPRSLHLERGRTIVLIAGSYT